MKKISALLLALLMTATVFTGCASKVAPPAPAPAPAPAPSTPAPAPSTPKGPAKIIKISNGINEKHPAYLGSMELKKIVEEKTSGAYEVQVYANAQLGDDVKATQDVAMGNLEMVVTSASPLVGMAPQLMVFDLPFIVPSEKAADAIYDGAVGKKLGDALIPNGLRLLTYYENGFRQLTNSAKEIKSPADLKGLKIRTMENPIHLAAFRAMGANPTPMPFSEVFTAMQQKTIDGQENPISTIYLNKFYEVQPFCTLTGHVYGPHIMLMSEKVYSAMSDADKKIFQDAANESAKLNRAENRKMCTDYIVDLEKAGMKVTTLTPEQSKAFQGACAPVYTEFEAKIGKDLIAEFKAVCDANK